MADAPAPLRPMGVAEILDGAVRLVRRNVRAVLPISVPFAVVSATATALVSLAAVDSKDAQSTATIGALVLAITFGVLLAGLLAPLYTSDLLGTRSTARESVRRVGVTGWALVGLAVVVTVAEAAGVAACVIGGVWLWGVWAVAAPALVLERSGVGGALGRSLALVRGTFWRIWGIRALGWILTSVLSLLITLPFEVLAGVLFGGNPLDSTTSVSHPAVYVVLLAAGSLISGSLIAPISAAIDVLLYTDLRMRKEGLDIVLSMPRVPAGPVEDRPVRTAW